MGAVTTTGGRPEAPGCPPAWRSAAIVSFGSNPIRAHSGPHHPSECSADGRFRPTVDLHQPPPADGSPGPGLDGDCCKVLARARF